MDKMDSLELIAKGIFAFGQETQLQQCTSNVLVRGNASELKGLKNGRDSAYLFLDPKGEPAFHIVLIGVEASRGKQPDNLFLSLGVLLRDEKRLYNITWNTGRESRRMTDSTQVLDEFGIWRKLTGKMLMVDSLNELPARLLDVNQAVAYWLDQFSKVNNNGSLLDKLVVDMAKLNEFELLDN